MKIKEIKQHNLFSIITVIVLLTADIVSYYISYFSVIFVKDIDGSIIDNPIFIALGIVFLFYFFNRYNPSSMQSRSKEVKVLFYLVSSFTAIYLFYKIILIRISIQQANSIILLAVLFLIVSIIFRLIIRTIQKQLFKLNIGLRKTVIIGAGHSTSKFINQIQKINIIGYDIVGYFYSTEDQKISNSYQYLGNFDNVIPFINNNNINEIFITLDKSQFQELLSMISNLKNMNVCIKILPDIYDVLTGQAKIHSVTGMPLMDINPHILTEFQFFIKRLLDVSISLISLVIMFPFFVVIMIIIKLTSNGDAIFKQKRIGFNGKEFTVYKFRTMFINSEEKTGPVWAKDNDPRITKFGNFLRKTRIDEFPQLYNVLLGNMSIVGPRPERDFFISQLKEKFPYYIRRLNVRPGITGWAQIMGSYDTDLDSVKNKLKLDFYYIENFSIWLDLRIMIITIWIMLKGKGQ